MVGPPSSKGQELRWLGDKKDRKRKQKFTKQGMQSKRKEEELESRDTRVGRAHGSGSCGLKGKKKDTDREAKVCCFKYGGQSAEETLNHTLILVIGKEKKAIFQNIWREVQKYQGSGVINRGCRELFTGHACV